MNNYYKISMAIIVVFLLTVFNSNYIQAQEDQNLTEMSLEDLLNLEVTTASKKAEKTSDAPGIISTITSEEIKYFGANNLADILEKSTSIQTIGSHLFPNNVSAMRGDLRTHYDNHMLILINGRPIRDGIMGGLNSPMYAGYPIDMIEKIEIVRGPGSVLYGSNAFAGVINVITKGDDDKSSLKVTAKAGSFGTIKGGVTGNYIKDDFKSKISLIIDNIKGWDFEAVTARPTFPNLSVSKKYGQKNIGVAADVNYKGLSFSGFYANNQHDMLGILPYATFEGVNKYDRLFLNVGYNHKISETWEATANITHSGSKLTLNDEALVAADKHSSSDYVGEITLGGELAENFNLIVGGVLDSRNKNEVGATDAIKEPYHLTQLSSYVQADYRPISDLKFIVGAQMNKPEEKDIDIVPRFGAIYNFVEEFGIKALFGQAFRSPWPVEQFLENPTIVGNPDLDPEKIATLDVQLFYTIKNAEVSLTYYNSKYTNSITRQPLADKPGVLTYVNLGELHMNGFEVEGKTTIISNVFIIGSATFQNNADENSVPIYIPNFMAKLGAFFNISKDLTIGLFNTYFGKPKENAGAIVNPEAKAVALVNLNINYKLPISLPLELSLNVQNLLNSDYNYTEFGRNWINTLPMKPGTAVYGGVGIQF
jgi:outer membrane receptor for ferrienterochelin and colicins